MIMNRYTPPRDFDVIRLGDRIASLLSYDIPREEIVTSLQNDGFTIEEIRLGYAAAKMMLKWQQE